MTFSLEIHFYFSIVIRFRYTVYCIYFFCRHSSTSILSGWADGRSCQSRSFSISHSTGRVTSFISAGSTTATRLQLHPTFETFDFSIISFYPSSFFFSFPFLFVFLSLRSYFSIFFFDRKEFQSIQSISLPRKIGRPLFHLCYSFY